MLNENIKTVEFNADKYTPAQAFIKIAQIIEKANELNTLWFEEYKKTDDDFTDDFESEDVFVDDENPSPESYFGKHMTEVVSELFALTAAVNGKTNLTMSCFNYYQDEIKQCQSELQIYAKIMNSMKQNNRDYLDPYQMIKDCLNLAGVQHIAQAIHECS